MTADIVPSYATIIMSKFEKKTNRYRQMKTECILLLLNIHW